MRPFKVLMVMHIAWMLLQVLTLHELALDKTCEVCTV